MSKSLFVNAKMLLYKAACEGVQVRVARSNLQIWKVQIIGLLDSENLSAAIILCSKGTKLNILNAT